MNHYSYFIIKPDGFRYIDKILKIIEEKGFESIYFFSINDFEEIIKKLYYKHYEEKGEKFEKGFKSYLYGVKEIYNNLGILIVVGDQKMDYQELCDKVFETKLSVREKFTNENIGIATNLEEEDGNCIQITSKSGASEKMRCLRKDGYHRINDLNMIHCPDPNIPTTLTELDILLRNGVISDENLIKPDMLNSIARYRCSTYMEDMKREDYMGIQTPNISGFISNCVNESEKEL